MLSVTTATGETYEGNTVSLIRVSARDAPDHHASLEAARAEICKRHVMMRELLKSQASMTDELRLCLMDTVRAVLTSLESSDDLLIYMAASSRFAALEGLCKSLCSSSTGGEVMSETQARRMVNPMLRVSRRFLVLVDEMIRGDQRFEVHQMVVSSHRFLRYAVLPTVMIAGDVVSYQNCVAMMTMASKCRDCMGGVEAKDGTVQVLDASLLMSDLVVRAAKENVYKRMVEEMDFTWVSQFIYHTQFDLTRCTRRTKQLINMLAGSASTYRQRKMTPSSWDRLGQAALEAMKVDNMEKELRRTNGRCMFAYMYRFFEICDAREDCTSKYCLLAVKIFVERVLNMVCKMFEGGSVVEGMTGVHLEHFCRHVSCCRVSTLVKLAERSKLKLAFTPDMISGIRSLVTVFYRYCLPASGSPFTNEELGVQATLDEHEACTLFFCLCIFWEDYMVNYMDVFKMESLPYGEDLAREEVWLGARGCS